MPSLTGVNASLGARSMTVNKEVLQFT